MQYGMLDEYLAGRSAEDVLISMPFLLPMPRKDDLHSDSRLENISGMTKKDAAYLLDATDDPETGAAIAEYQRSVYAGAKEPAAEVALPLSAKVEKKYAAATVVAQGVQVRRVGSGRVRGQHGKGGVNVDRAWLLVRGAAVTPGSDATAPDGRFNERWNCDDVCHVGHHASAAWGEGCQVVLS
eukprot:42307-Chlamydomonas_euryale.AAC.2